MFENAAARPEGKRPAVVEQAFTLIELAIAVAVIGILVVVALVGIAGMTKKNGTCSETAATAASASAVFFRTYQRFPARWSDLTTTIPRSYVPDKGVTINPVAPKELDGSGWRLVMSGNGKAIPTFTCE